jgi:hypothetical protein
MMVFLVVSGARHIILGWRRSNAGRSAAVVGTRMPSHSAAWVGGGDACRRGERWGFTSEEMCQLAWLRMDILVVAT